MTEQQQYRVIADRDKGDDPKVADIAIGDRYTYESAYSSWTDMGDDDPIIRIERPVPTTDEPKHQVMCLPLDVYEASIGMLRLHGAEATADMLRDEAEPPSLPTREQIAEALYRQQQRPAVRIVWSELPEWVRAVYFDMADAVLALLQKWADR